jgi:glycosyltransferase involved in cell wall biosynthesis
MRNEVVEGLSVIICSHNGASRLQTTLALLKVQEPPARPWEVVLVDNASTDSSAEVRTLLLAGRSGTTSYSRRTTARSAIRQGAGLAKANYAFLGFVDDDNWVASDWVRTAYSIMSLDARLGALGSIRTPVCEASLPVWFENVHSAYAILTDREFKQIEEPLMYLEGRRSAARGRNQSALAQGG